MTYYNLINAVPSFQKLIGQNLPLRTAYKMSKVVRRINEELEFYRQKEGALQVSYGSDIPQTEREELLGFEIEWSEDKVDLQLDTVIQLSCADIEALEPFINFVE